MLRVSTEIPRRSGILVTPYRGCSKTIPHPCPPSSLSVLPLLLPSVLALASVQTTNHIDGSVFNSLNPPFFLSPHLHHHITLSCSVGNIQESRAHEPKRDVLGGSQCCQAKITNLTLALISCEKKKKKRILWVDGVVTEAASFEFWVLDDVQGFRFKWCIRNSFFYWVLGRIIGYLKKVQCIGFNEASDCNQQKTNPLILPYGGC